MRFGSKTVWIFGTEKRLPRWFTQYDWGDKIKYNSGKLFDPYREEGLEVFKEGQLEISISNDVRSMLELLSLVPKEQSIEEAKELMLGLVSVIPKKAEMLLQLCTSI